VIARYERSVVPDPEMDPGERRELIRRMLARADGGDGPTFRNAGRNDGSGP